MWFALFSGRASCWLIFSLVSTCPFHEASPRQPLYWCLGLSQPKVEHDTSLCWYSYRLLLALSSGLSRTILSEALPFSVSTTPNFLASSKLLMIHSVLLSRSLIVFVSDQQLVVKTLIGSLWDQQSRQLSRHPVDHKSSASRWEDCGDGSKVLVKSSILYPPDSPHQNKTTFHRWRQSGQSSMICPG